MRTLILMTIMVTAGVGLADALQFWGEGSPSTNRAGAVSHVVSLTTFSSLEWANIAFALQEFNSSHLGLVLVVH